MVNVSKWLLKERFQPIVAELHITNRCNLNCKTCWKYNKKLDYSEEISSQKWSSLINQIISMGIKECYICGGGEPMSRAGITMQIISKIKKNMLRGIMTTNCTLFKGGDIKKMINLEWDELQVSIDGPDAATQNFLKGKVVYEKNIRTLKLFNKWKKKLKKEKPYISFHTVLSNKNYNKLQKIILFADRLRIKEVNLQPLVLQSEYCKGFVLNPQQKEELQKELKKALIIAKKKNIVINFERFLKKEKHRIISNEKIKCFEPWNRLTILSDGKVKTCCNPNRMHEPIHKKSLEEIWYGKKFNRLRKKFYKGKLMKECCTHPNKR